MSEDCSAPYDLAKSRRIHQVNIASYLLTISREQILQYLVVVVEVGRAGHGILYYILTESNIDK